MRNVIFGINVTLDGCCDHTKGNPYEAVHTYFTELLRSADTLVYGRKTYQLMVPFWPDMAKSGEGPAYMAEFARVFAGVGEVVVFSKTLEKAERSNERIVRANPVDAIQRLKREPGRNILLGGVDLPSQLLAAGVIDEFRILVQPTIVGEGRRLFEEVHLPEKLNLQLAESTHLGSGCIALRYVR